MIHTMTIRYWLSKEDFSVLQPDIEKSPHFNKAARNAFLANKKYASKSKKEQNDYCGDDWLTFIMSSGTIGIEHIKFFKQAKCPDDIYLDIMIDIEALIEGQRTINLFYPDYYGAKAACLAYSAAILRIFPILNQLSISDSELINAEKATLNKGLMVVPYLSHGKVVRFEYSNNLLAENKELAMELMSNSIRPTSFWQKEYKANDNTFLGQGQKKKPTSIFKAYDKELKLLSDNNPIESSLVDSAENIIRCEYGRNRFDNDWITRNYGLSSSMEQSPFIRSPLLLFDSRACEKIFKKMYSKQIGLGDWFNKCEFSKKIPLVDKAILGPQQKNTILRELAPIVSQARSIKAGFKKYQQADGYHIAKTARSPSGSEEKFKKYLRLLDAADIQLLRIPDKRHVTYIENPIKNIAAAPRITRTLNYPLPELIKDNIVSVLDYIWRECNRFNPTKINLSKVLASPSIYCIISD